MTRTAIAILLTLAFTCAATVASAAERRPVPPMTLVDATGASVTSASLSPESQWLLVYVTPGSPAADRLISAMKGWELGTSLRKVVFVVDARGAEAQAWVARVLPQTEENLPPRYLDRAGEAKTALRVTNTPTLIGVKDGQIAWDLAGVLNDPAALEPVIRNWIK